MDHESEINIYTFIGLFSQCGGLFAPLFSMWRPFFYVFLRIRTPFHHVKASLSAPFLSMYGAFFALMGGGGSFMGGAHAHNIYYIDKITVIIPTHIMCLNAAAGVSSRKHEMVV